jgi:hypothetical protein
MGYPAASPVDLLNSPCQEYAQNADDEVFVDCQPKALYPAIAFESPKHIKHAVVFDANIKSAASGQLSLGLAHRAASAINRAI